MVDSVNNIKQYSYYNTVSAIKSNTKTNDTTSSIANNTRFSTIPFSAGERVLNKRTELASGPEKKKYTELLNTIKDKNVKKQLNALLKSGILLDSNSNDNSTVLDNLHKIATTPRAQGLDNKNILKDTIGILSSPFTITQHIGDIPIEYREQALAANTASKSHLVDTFQATNDIDVEHSGTCVAASIEFNLAEAMPAEFTRFAEGLSSPKMSVDKEIKLKNLADNTLDAIWLLNAFEIPYVANDFNNAKLTFAPDKNAILRAQIQTTHKDPLERSPLDVLMQSTFMQVGSQQTYNSLTDKREGKFNQNPKGLIEFEKTFTESVVADKNILSVTYQTVDENARLIGYETDQETLKRHLLTAIDMGENVILGYTYVDKNNIVIGGHEITVVDYKKDSNGKLIFVCNDTDDDNVKPIEYTEDYLLPKIHHAALPQKVVEADMTVTPNWVEGLNIYKDMKKRVS